MPPALLPLLLLSCTGVEGSGPGQPGLALAPAPSAATVPAPAEVAAALPTVHGAWASPSCGERTWTRALRLEPDGTWVGRDLVSPCPPDVACVWSGIVERKGTWTQSPLGAVLDPGADAPATAPGGERFPSRVQVEALAGGSAELLDDFGCRYQPVATLP